MRHPPLVALAACLLWLHGPGPASAANTARAVRPGVPALGAPALLVAMPNAPLAALDLPAMPALAEPAFSPAADLPTLPTPAFASEAAAAPVPQETAAVASQEGKAPPLRQALAAAGAAAAEAVKAPPAAAAESSASAGSSVMAALTGEALRGGGSVVLDKNGTPVGEHALLVHPEERFPVRRRDNLRPFLHVGRNWQGRVALMVPLTAREHAVLARLSLAPYIALAAGALPLVAWKLARISSGGDALMAVFVVASMAFFLWFGAWALAGPHLKEWRDARAVERNARRYRQYPENARLDKDLLAKAAKFEAATGWRIDWVESDFLLALARPQERRLAMSVGWVVASVDPRDRRRLAYLHDTLLNVQKGIPPL